MRSLRNIKYDKVDLSILGEIDDTSPIRFRDIKYKKDLDSIFLDLFNDVWQKRLNSRTPKKLKTLIDAILDENNYKQRKSIFEKAKEENSVTGEGRMLFYFTEEERQEERKITREKMVLEHKRGGAEKNKKRIEEIDEQMKEIWKGQGTLGAVRANHEIVSKGIWIKSAETLTNKCNLDYNSVYKIGYETQEIIRDVIRIITL